MTQAPRGEAPGFGLGRVRRALGHRNHFLFAAGMAPSLITLWMQRLAVGWLTWELTHSPAWLGIIAFADLFPSVVLSPLAGALIDRVDPMRPMVLCQIVFLVQALILAVLSFAGLITIEILLALELLLGLTHPFNTASRYTILPSLVPRADLSVTIAINSSLYNVARFIGPAAAGAVIVIGGVSWAFAGNVLGYLVFLLALFRMDVAPPERGARSKAGLFGDVAEGWRYTVAHPGIRPVLALLIITAVVSRPVVDLLPGFAGDVFHRGAGGLAWLTAAMGLGAMGGALWLTLRGALTGLTTITITAVLFLALALLAFTATDNFFLALVFLALSGFAMVVNGIGSQTLIQSSVTSAMRGRVMSLYALIYRGMPALGAVGMGWLAEGFGLPATLGGGAVLCLIAWGWAARRRRGMAVALEGKGPD
ncbi:MAG: MFS transporter [Proteobacteria bacterium]|nr:MFS transporter [Pseudomonadota bacterium]